MKKISNSRYCTVNSEQACKILSVSSATLYAYVSRGLIRAMGDPKNAHRSLYDRRDIESLRKNKKRSRKLRDVAASSLDWGEPSLQSEITTITDGQCFYRGINSSTLAETHSFEELIGFLNSETDRPNPVKVGVPTVDLGRPPFLRIFEVVSNAALLALSDCDAIDTSSLIRQMALVAAGMRKDSGEKIHEMLSGAWSDDSRSGNLIRKALVLCADHELNASTFAVRVAASSGTTSHGCLLVGLSTLSGSRHGGVSAHCKSWFSEMIARNSEQQKLEISKEPIPPGFSHPLYPEGDPRAALLLSQCPAPKKWEQIIRMVREERNVMPNIDLALVVLEHELQLPEGAALAIFAIGRSAGWIAHSQEQRLSGKLIRPRATVDT